MEDLGELQGIVMTLLRGRYWNSLKGRAVPFYQEKQKIRDEVVDEFANRTLKTSRSMLLMALCVLTIHLWRNKQCKIYKMVTSLTQPLNEGINSISYMEYFQNLYCKYYKDLKVNYLPRVCEIIDWLKARRLLFLEETFVRV